MTTRGRRGVGCGTPPSAAALFGVPLVIMKEGAMLPNGKLIARRILIERWPIILLGLAGVGLLVLLLSGCGEYRECRDLDQCNIDCVEEGYALGTCIEERCECVPNWGEGGEIMIDGGPD